MNNDQNSESTNQRISRLERENRTIKTLGLFLLGALITLILSGANRDIPEKIVAQQFALCNEKGELLASLSADPLNSIPSLQFFDPRPGGVIQSNYSMNSVSFNGEVRRGTAHRIEMGMLEDNQPGFKIRDNQGKYRLECGVAANNEPFFIMQDREEKKRIAIHCDENDIPSITILDTNGKDRAVLTLRDDGTPMLSLFRINKHVSFGIGGGMEQSAGMSLIDHDGRDLIVIKALPNGDADIKLQSFPDKNGALNRK